MDDIQIFDLGGDGERFDYQVIKFKRTGEAISTTIFLRIWITPFSKVKMQHVKPEEVPQNLRDKYHLQSGERY